MTIGLTYTYGRTENDTTESGTLITRVAGQFTSPMTSCPVQEASSHRMRLPVTSTQMTSTVGGVLVYFDPDNAYNAGGQHADGIIWRWAASDLDLDYIQLDFLKASGLFRLHRYQAGAGTTLTVAATFAAGAATMIYAAWDATTLYLGVNGTTPSTAADTHVPAGLPTTFDVGGGGTLLLSGYITALLPTAYWKLGEASGDALDSSASGLYPGTVTIGAGARDATALDDGGDGAIDFDGANTKVSVADVAALRNPFDGGGSVAVIVNLDTVGEGGFGVILSKLIGATGWEIYTREVSAGFVKVAFDYYWSGATASWRTTNRPLALGVSTLMVLTYNADSTTNDPTLTLVDLVTGTVQTLTVGGGITENTSPVGTRVTDTGNALVIGNNAGQSETSDGRIDEVAVWKGTVLSAAQIVKMGVLAAAAYRAMDAAYGCVAGLSAPITAAQAALFAALRADRPPLYGEFVHEVMTLLWYGANAMTWTLATGGKTVDLMSLTGLKLHAINGMGHPPMEHRNVSTPLRDGAAYVDSRMRTRVVSLPMTVNAGDAALFQTARMALLSRTNPRLGEGMLMYAPSAICYELDAVVTGGIELSRYEPKRIQRIIAVLACFDPAIRCAAVQHLLGTIALGGWSLPWSLPWSLSDGAVTATINNDGDIDSWPEFRIIAGASGMFAPYFTNVTTGLTYSLNGGAGLELAAGETLLVNMLDRTCTVDSVNAHNYRSTDSRMWTLVPGDNSIMVGAQSGGGTMLMRHHIQHIGV